MDYLIFLPCLSRLIKTGRGKTEADDVVLIGYMTAIVEQVQVANVKEMESL